jgi:hypothetical protein
LVELPFWLGLLAFVLVCGIGGMLGRFVGQLLFRQSFRRPDNQPKA